MRGLAGKRVLVSGGTSGIGAAAARRLAEEGARVHVTGATPAEVERFVEGGGGVAISASACDVTDEGAVADLVGRVVAELGAVDLLANNAGVGWREPFLEITSEHWDRIMAVNLRGMFLVARAVARHMVDAGRGGAIVNMSSTNGLGGEEDYAHYNASKAGVLLLTRTMAVELGRHAIRVNALCPGYIETPLNATIAEGLDGDFVARYVAGRIPLGRVGRPEDVAAAYAFLLSDDAAFVSGAELVIDGGQLAVM